MTSAAEASVRASGVDWTPRLQGVALWAVGFAVALTCALLSLPASRLGDSFVPVGNDSFYHARRILDAVADLTRFYQFDPRMHAPEGAIVSWPWGYDFGMAVLARLALWAGITHDPMRFLVFVPPACLALSIALLMAITQRLGFSAFGRTLVVLCFALSPLTQMLHGVGVLDHHYMESIFWLASVWAVLAWLEVNAKPARAVFAGTVMGLAPAIHCDLFILQLPLVLSLLTLVFRRRAVQLPHVKFFASALICATLMAAAPSLAFREGRFEILTLSWFHVYAAVATSAWCLWLNRGDGQIRSPVVVLVVAGLTSLPGLSEIPRMGGFLTGTLSTLGDIIEVRSPLAAAFDPGGFWRICGFYSLLLWTAPLVAIGSLVELWKCRDAGRGCFWAACLLGLVLLMTQMRFSYFGMLGLLVPLVLWAERAIRGLADDRRTLAMLALGLALLVAYEPAIAGQLFRPPPLADDFDYALTRELYQPLAMACRREPGIVLASINDGHYVRFHTECSTIADTFTLSREDGEKIRQVQDLLALSPNELAAKAPQVRYVLVHLENLFRRDARGRAQATPLAEVFQTNSRLVRELVLSDAGSLPKRFHLLQELKFQGEGGHPYARVFELRQSEARAEPDSSR